MDPLRLRKDRELIIKILYEIDSTSHELETIINNTFKRIKVNASRRDYISSTSEPHQFKSALQGIGYTLVSRDGSENLLNNPVEEYDFDELTPLFLRFVFSLSIIVLIFFCSLDLVYYSF